MPGFPGTGSGIGNPLPSGDPSLPQSLISPAVMQQVRNALGSEQMKMLASQETQAKFESVVEKMLTAMVTKSLESMDKSPTGHAKLLGLAATLASQQAGLGTPATSTGPSIHTAPHSPEQAILAGGMPQGVEPATPTSTLREQFNAGRSVTMGGIAKKASGAVAAYVSQHTPNWNLIDDEETAQRLNVPTGSLVQYTGETDDKGNPVISQSVSPDNPDFAKTLRHVRRDQLIYAGLTNASEGGSLITGRLGMAAGRLAGGVGIALGVAQATDAAMTSQRNRAAPFRQAFGEEGTGFFAAGERLNEFKAGLGGFFGGIGSDRAREDFRAASALGLRGDRRTGATDFSSDMFKRFGMSSDDAMKIVQQSLTEGNISLNAYAAAISKVTKAAVDGGKAASGAIQELVNATDLAASRGLSGNTALAVGRNAAAASAGMDRQTAAAFGGAQGIVQMSTDQRNIMLSAAQSGQNPIGALYRSQAGGQTSVAQNVSTLNASTDMVVRQIAGFYRVPESQIRRDAKGVTEPQRQQEINLGWAGGDEQKAFMGLRLMMSLMAQHGQTPKDEPDALKMFFAMAGGSLTGSMDPTGGISSSDTLKGGVKDYLGYDPKIVRAVGGRGAGVMNIPEQMRSEVGRKYIDTIDDMGRSKSIENLISSKDLKSFTGSGLDDDRFIVTDSSGKQKTVGLSTIINNKDYRAQLAQGDVVVKGKGKEQKNVSDFTKVDTNGEVTGAGGGAAGGGTSKVQIEFTGYAARWLKITGPTDAERAGMPGAGSYNPDTAPLYGGQ